ncbi:hypothetical protein [Jiella pelagia]|uniref:Uncharacterized protein n=1 Tax=Jiella pelagia TaxID=2986949 RepID=A0ABY7C2T3_9HYPH|nr:hypothetical protein [Jiella pelagia]WAP69073.1 hypothetical protein OH818_01680 [Jiella pelagia]
MLTKLRYDKINSHRDDESQEPNAYYHTTCYINPDQFDSDEAGEECAFMNGVDEYVQTEEANSTAKLCARITGKPVTVKEIYVHDGYPNGETLREYAVEA